MIDMAIGGGSQFFNKFSLMLQLKIIYIEAHFINQLSIWYFVPVVIRPFEMCAFMMFEQTKIQIHWKENKKNHPVSS